MTLYRESFSLSIPRTVAENRLRERYGPPAPRGSALRWEVGRTGPYRFAITLDGDRVEVTARTPLPYAGLVAGVGAALGCLALGLLPTVAVAILGAGCLALALLPALPGNPWLDVGIPLPVDAQFEGRTYTAYGLVPLAGVLGCALAVLDGALAQAVVAVSTSLGAVGYLVHVDRFSRLQAQAPLFVLPLVASGPILIVGANLVALREFLPLVPRPSIPLLLGALVANTVALLAVFHVACDRGCRVVRRLPNAPLDSLGIRVAWAVVVVAVNAGLLSFGLAVVAATVGVLDAPALALPVGTMIAGVAAAGVPLPAVWVVACTLVLLAPLVALFGFWGYDVARSALRRRRLLDATVPADDPAVDYPVRLLDADAPNAFAVSTFLGRRRAIVATTGLRDVLDDDAFVAVLAHEAYHLDRRDPLRNALASTVGVAVGGENAVLALLDYPTIEREADRYAARAVGPATVARALRRLDEHAAGAAPWSAPNRRAEPAAAGRRSPRLATWRRIALAPFALLFGDHLLDAAHATVDERVRAVLEE